MIDIDGLPWDRADDGQKRAFCESLLESARSARELYDLEWYQNYQYENGNHFMLLNTTTGKLEVNPPKRKGEVRIVVNKIRSTKRAVLNYVVREKPKWEIIPGDTDEQTIKTARTLGKTMDFVYRKLHLEQMVTGVVDTGLSNSIGIVEVDWDESAEGGLGEVRIRLHDPFDVWFANGSYLYAGKLVSRFLAKTVTRSTSEVKADKRYDEKARKEVKPDEELAVSRLKAKILKKEMSSSDNSEKKQPTSTVKEFMLWDDEKNSKGGHIKLYTYCGDQTLSEKDLDEMEYPTLIFQIQMNPLKIYQRAWVSDAIPLNKAIDVALSQKIMYMNKALRFRILAEKGHGASVITTDDGDIIEINKGRAYNQMDIHPMPAGYDAVSNEANSYLEDTFGAHDAAVGRMPTGARSGDTLEAIQAADANNLTGLTASLESFLSVVGERVLNIISKKYSVSRIAKIAEPEDGNEYIKVIGESAERKPDGAVVVPGDNEVIVKIGSWLGHTLEAKRETMLKLAEGGILPAEEVLKQFEFPNVEELSAKAREQRLEQGQMDLAIAGHAGGNAQGGAPQNGTDPQAMIQIADKENMAMMQGQVLPPTEGADITHTQAHADFMRSKMFTSLPMEVQQVFSNHVNGELQAHGMGGANAL